MLIANETSTWEDIQHHQSLRLCLWAVTQLHPTFCNPMDCNPPPFSVHEIFQTRILEWVAISCSRGSSWSRDQTHVSCVSCISMQILYHCASLGKCKTTIQWDAIIHLLKHIKLQWLSIPSDNEKAKPLECSYTAGGNVKWYSHCVTTGFFFFLNS